MQPKVADVLLEDDRLIEVSWNGDIVWEWVASDHIDELGFAADARKAIKAAQRLQQPRGAASTGCTSTRRPMSDRTGGSTRATDASRRTT